jgi:hypothetical protein
MSIIAANIYARVVQITQRDTAKFTQEYFNILLLEACNEIALRTGFLRDTDTGTIDSDNQSPAPTDMLSDLSVETFYLGTDVLDPISFEEWRQNVRRGYCVYNGIIYVEPTRGNTKDYTIYYDRTHGAIDVNLEFPDIYQPAIVQLSASKTYGDYEIEDKEEYRRQKFEGELAKLPSPTVNITHGRGSDRHYV